MSTTENGVRSRAADCSRSSVGCARSTPDVSADDRHRALIAVHAGPTVISGRSLSGGAAIILLFGVLSRCSSTTHSRPGESPQSTMEVSIKCMVRGVTGVAILALLVSPFRRVPSSDPRRHLNTLSIDPTACIALGTPAM
jgi:hypothetical protein